VTIQQEKKDTKKNLVIFLKDTNSEVFFSKLDFFSIYTRIS